MFSYERDYLLGCIIRGIERYGGDIDRIGDVSNQTECNRHCNERTDCFLWTYIEGRCYVKNENTFRMKRSNVVGGIKECKPGKPEGDRNIS